MNAETGAAHTRPAAILIVNGGQKPEDDRWIRLCLDRIARHTDSPAYHIYLWNNRLGAPELEAWLHAQPRLTLLSAASHEALNHPHRTPLQRLYHLARQEGAYYIVALDSDAHPLRDGWLAALLAKLDEGAAVAGVWRDVMTPAIRPHVHASCLCTTVDFVESYGLRFDFDTTHARETIDTLSHFTWVAEAHNLPIHRLPRTNQRQYHAWMGGIYGDLVYHHVAASRTNVVFRDSPQRGRAQSDHNTRVRDVAADLLFSNYEAVIGWLQGSEVDPMVAARLAGLEAEERRRNHTLALSSTPRASAAPVLFPLGQRLKRRLSRVLHRLTGGPIDHHTRSLIAARGDAKGLFPPMFMPFRREDLAPLPAHGWTAGPPDFVGIGAPKCGTTWWHRLLLEHPQIVDNRWRHKELQHFLHSQYRALPAAAVDVYREAFARAPGTVCGELSSQYLAYPLSLEHLALAAPAAKILVFLRNPIDRFISHMNQLITKRKRRYFLSQGPLADYLLRSYSFYAETMLHSLYSIGLARLFRYFARDQVLVLQLERSVQFPAEELARTYRFVGVDDRWQAKNLRDPVKSSRYVIAKPEADERRRLAAYFHDDVQRVFALCPELDPALWPDFTVRPAGE